MKRVAKSILGLVDGFARRRGYQISVGALDPAYQDIIDTVRPYTMTSPERITATCQAVEHVCRYGVPGDFVECGVWRGGSTMAAALSYMRAGNQRPTLHLFDTFEGMADPTEADVAHTGESAKAMLNGANKSEEIWCYSPIDEVRRNVASTGYPMERVTFVKGKVEDTIPQQAPEQIAVLRLDTDWYESTRHELVNLFPRLSPGGVLIIDDYGHWEGARKAVDEFFATHDTPMLLCRTDYTGRMGVKVR